IPDDLAAILACMMAKDPAHRYQHPVLLAEHLRQLAQRLGLIRQVSVSTNPIAVPLPPIHYNPRPFLLALCSCALLVVLIVLPAILTRPASNGISERVGFKTNDSTGMIAGAKEGPISNPALRDAGNSSAAEGPVEVQTARELVEALQRKQPRVHIVLAKD